MQRASGKVRVVVQLIEAKSDQHLWAETYDRPLDDVFAVQSEIAGQIAGALHASLTPQESAALKTVPTDNQKAYDLFLRAEHILRSGVENFTTEGGLEAIGLYRQALAEDNRFALAYARLSFAESYFIWIGGASRDVSLEEARSKAEKALALQPDLVQAHLALAYCDYYGRFDYAKALEHLARARALAPKNTDVLVALGSVYRRQLRFDDAIAAFESATQYDPANSLLFFVLAGTYQWAGYNDKAQPTYEHALALDPNNRAAAGFLSRFLIEQRGDVEGARKILRGGSPALQRLLSYTYELTRDYEKAIEIIEDLPADSSAFPSESKDALLGLTSTRRAATNAPGLSSSGPVSKRSNYSRTRNSLPGRSFFARSTLRKFTWPLATGPQRSKLRNAARNRKQSSTTRSQAQLTGAI